MLKNNIAKVHIATRVLHIPADKIFLLQETHTKKIDLIKLKYSSVILFAFYFMYVYVYLACYSGLYSFCACDNVVCFKIFWLK